MSVRSLIPACLTIVLVGCAPAGGEPAQEAAEVDVPSPFLEDVESRVVTSTSGRDYQISVALPADYAGSTNNYPVLYAVDANGQFGMVVETVRLLNIADPDPQVPELIVVGIGYPVGGRQTGTGPYRVFDLTAAENAIFTAERGRLAGGASDYLRFIERELVPDIDSRYRTIPSDRAFYGHSAGGHFALYALFEGDGTFSRVIAASPSLWWGDGILFDIEEAYAGRSESLTGRLFLSVGSEERSLQLPWGTTDMVPNLRRFADILERRQYRGLTWTAHEFEGENHQSVIPASVSRGLRFIYDSPR